MTEGPPAVDAEALLHRVMDMISATRSIPLSSSVKLDNKDEVLELLDQAVHRLPTELRDARYLLKEREEFLAKVAREADDILEAARVRAERMVERQEIVREARHTAQRTLEAAQADARRLRHEAEDYCDQKLAGFEIVLERTVKTVRAGREKLRANPASAAEEDLALGGDAEAEVFFDQDSS